MSKVFKSLLVIAIFVVTATASFASSIDYRGNQSADYIRTLNRNAALDGADLVLYNPAGAAMLEDGIHVNAGLQFLFKTYTAETEAGDEYESDYPSLFLPNLYGVYKQDNWAAFMGFHIPAGGGTVKYEDGLPLMASYAPLVAASAGSPITSATWTSGDFEAKSIYYGFTIGGAYAVNEMVSVSLAGRIIYANRTYKGEANYDLYVGTANVSSTTLEADAERTATGFGGIIGVDIKPMEELNIGIRYESKTSLDFETTVNDDKRFGTLFTDGEKANRDLPAVLGIGIAYDISEELKATAGITYFFIKQATADDAYEDYDNGYDLSVGAEYFVMPELLLSVGYMWSDTGANEDTVSDFDNTLDSHNVALGSKYTVAEDVDLSLGFIYSKYIDIENASETVTYKKVVYTLAVGANAKF